MSPAIRYYLPEVIHDLDLVTAPGTPIRLRGARCVACGAAWFPLPQLCAACHARDLETLILAPTSTLYSFSVVHVARSGMRVPYAVGVVDFSAGVRVFGQIEGWQAGLRVGQAVEAIVGVIRFETDGAPTLGYKFRPVTA